MANVFTELEVIDWYDHCSMPDGSWHSLSEFKNHPQGCRSVGFVIAENDTSLVLVAHVPLTSDDSDEVCGDMCIVKSAIIQRQKIQIGS